MRQLHDVRGLAVWTVLQPVVLLWGRARILRPGLSGGLLNRMHGDSPETAGPTGPTRVDEWHVRKRHHL